MHVAQLPQRAQMPGSEGMCPHQRVHRGCKHQRPLRVPSSRHTRDQVVAQAIRELGESVGRERGQHEEVGPVAKVYVLDWVTFLLPHFPFVRIGVHGTSLSKGGEIYKAQGRLCRNHNHREIGLQ